MRTYVFVCSGTEMSAIENKLNVTGVQSHQVAQFLIKKNGDLRHFIEHNNVTYCIPINRNCFLYICWKYHIMFYRNIVFLPPFYRIEINKLKPMKLNSFRGRQIDTATTNRYIENFCTFYKCSFYLTHILVELHFTGVRTRLHFFS